MDVFIGVDEAGYGPNFGPMVVAATAWGVEGREESGVRGQESGGEAESSGLGVQGSGKKSSAHRGGGSAALKTPKSRAKTRAADLRHATGGLPDLYSRLRAGVVRLPAECARRVAIADSKALYKPGLGLRQLERGVLAALGCVQARDPEPQAVATFGELIAATGSDVDGRRRGLVCHDGDGDGVPVDCAGDELAEAGAVLGKACAAEGVAILCVRARLVYPAEFNALCDELGTKGAALSHVTLALVREVVDSLSADETASECASETPRRIAIFLDKHGGRSRYAALVQHHFSESWIEPMDEGRAESRYRWEHRGARVEAAFRVGCEEFLPTALASMTAKYQRELAMRAFNAFWAQRVPGIRPTAGYPGDAGRFRQEIAAAQAELGIADRLLWRNR